MCCTTPPLTQAWGCGDIKWPGLCSLCPLILTLYFSFWLTHTCQHTLTLFCSEWLQRKWNLLTLTSFPPELSWVWLYLICKHNQCLFFFFLKVSKHGTLTEGALCTTVTKMDRTCLVFHFCATHLVNLQLKTLSHSFAGWSHHVLSFFKAMVKIMQPGRLRKVFIKEEEGLCPLWSRCIVVPFKYFVGSKCHLK